MKMVRVFYKCCVTRNATADLEDGMAEFCNLEI